MKSTLSLQKTLNLFQITVTQFRSWSRNRVCVSSAYALCRRIYFNQLTETEVRIIKKQLTNPEYIHWPLSALYYKLLREGKAFFSLGTFYKYAKLLNLSKLHKPIRKIKYKIGIRAEKPFQILHMDITELRVLDGTRIYISLIIDNFSRCILAAKASLTKSSAFAVENLMEAVRNYNLFDINESIQLLVDGGSENKGKVDDFLNQPKSKIKKLVALLDVLFSNSMIEAVNKIIKYDYLFWFRPRNFEHLVEMLPQVVHSYINRPHSKLYGYTPVEVLAGAIPDKHLFSADIKNAVIKRINSNVNGICDKCITA